MYRPVMIAEKYCPGLHAENSPVMHAETYRPVMHAETYRPVMHAEK